MILLRTALLLLTLGAACQAEFYIDLYVRLKPQKEPSVLGCGGKGLNGTAADQHSRHGTSYAVV